MDLYNIIDSAMANLAGFLWGTPLVMLLLGGGIFFAAYSRLVPMLYFKHGIDILLGKYDSDDDPLKLVYSSPSFTNDDDGKMIFVLIFLCLKFLQLSAAIVTSHANDSSTPYVNVIPLTAHTTGFVLISPLKPKGSIKFFGCK